MTRIDCTFPAGGGQNALRDALLRIRAEAEDAVRSGAGHIVLTDHHQGAGKVADADDPGDLARCIAG
jgi:glutamate synthase (NADPH) large chain